MGGGIDTANSGTLVRNYGGAGGGGGFHRVRGLLSALPAICPVVVGAGGALGTEMHGSNPARTTNGGDGGASSFNATTCRASGGKGGKTSSIKSIDSRYSGRWWRWWNRKSYDCRRWSCRWSCWDTNCDRSWHSWYRRCRWHVLSECW